MSPRTKKTPGGRPAKKAVEKFPATGDMRRDAPHVGRAVKGCACMSCRAHRMLERQAKRNRIRELLSEQEPMIGEPIWHQHNLM